MSMALRTRIAAPLLRTSPSTVSRRWQSTDPTTREVAQSESSAKEKRAVTQARPEGDLVAAGVVSGAPDELYTRPVRIYQPAIPSTSSAKATSHHWRIDWDTLPGGGRYTNALMGWAASSDYMQGTHIKFNSKEAAIRFAEKQGYPWFVQEPQQAKFVPKSYSDNFLYSKDKLRLMRTK